METKWLIIEDGFSRAKCLIEAIRIRDDLNPIVLVFANIHILPEDQSDLQIFCNHNKSDVIFCRDEKSLIYIIDSYKHENLIVLLDIELIGVSEKVIPNSLTNTIKDVMELKDQYIRFILRTTTGRDDNLVKALGLYSMQTRSFDRRFVTGGWDFASAQEPLLEACNAINAAIARWEEFAGLSINEFLVEMKKLSQEECHSGWGGQNAPIQFANLSRLLGYSTDSFAEMLGISYESCQNVVGQTLIKMGCSDSESVSVVAIAFIAWAAYRNVFPDGEGNDRFADAIKSVYDSDSENWELSRNSSVIVEQKYESLAMAVKSLHQVFVSIYKADRHNSSYKEGDDLLHDVQLDSKNGLRIYLNMNPDKLAKTLHNLADSLIMKKDNIGSEHTVSWNILKFWIRSSVGECMTSSEDSVVPFFVPNYPLRISSWGYDKKGTLLSFSK